MTDSSLHSQQDSLPLSHNTNADRLHNSFTANILKWFDQFGRKSLPWQKSQHPYSIWISEIMLQQTQVATVIPYYERFMASFPDVVTLAKAEQDDVLHHWTGLGYYARARNLHKAAKIITEEHAGLFPEDIDALIDLPGIGRSTAGAILSFSTEQRHPILDGNVKRVLCRYFGVEGWPGKVSVQSELWELADQCTPNSRIANYTQAIMDFGATQCKRSSPDCANCPLAKSCFAFSHELTKELPTKKPKKVTPIKKSVFLVIENNKGETLLIKRPPVGIWGGLWCMPEISYEELMPSNEHMIEWVNHNLGLMADTFDSESFTEGDSFRHTFSHFHHEVTTVKIKLSNDSSMQLNDLDNHIWFNAANNLQIGLAAPIKKLLRVKPI